MFQISQMNWQDRSRAAGPAVLQDLQWAGKRTVSLGRIRYKGSGRAARQELAVGSRRRLQDSRVL